MNIIKSTILTVALVIGSPSAFAVDADIDQCTFAGRAAREVMTWRQEGKPIEEALSTLASRNFTGEKSRKAWTGLVLIAYKDTRVAPTKLGKDLEIDKFVNMVVIECMNVK